MDFEKICLISSLENLWICSTVVFNKLLNDIKYNIKLRNGMVLLKMKFCLTNGKITLECQKNRFIFCVMNCDLT